MSRVRRWIPVVLVVPFVALLWVPFYNHAEPRLGGFPFFYVWLLAWTIITAALTWLTWRVQRGHHG